VSSISRFLTPEQVVTAAADGEVEMLGVPPVGNATVAGFLIPSAAIVDMTDPH